MDSKGETVFAIPMGITGDLKGIFIGKCEIDSNLYTLRIYDRVDFPGISRLLVAISGGGYSSDFLRASSLFMVFGVSPYPIANIP